MNQSKHRRDIRAVNKIAGDLSQVRREIAGMLPIEVGGYLLPFTQRLVNPITSTNFLGDYPIIRPGTVLKLFSCSVYVVAPNNSTNYWVISIENASGVDMMTVNTQSGVTAAVWTRISTETVIVPITSEVIMTLILTKIGAPGALFTLPAVYVL